MSTAVRESWFADQEGSSLVDLLDTLLDTGAVVCGDLMLSVAGIDLVWVGLKAIVSSVETAHPAMLPVRSAAAAPVSVVPAMSPVSAVPAMADMLANLGGRASETRASSVQQASDRAAPMTERSTSPARRLDLEADKVERGLVQLVLTLVDLLRELLERQAVKRMSSGSLSEREVEQLGSAFQKLAGRMEDLKEYFGLDDSDLRLDLVGAGRTTGHPFVDQSWLGRDTGRG